MNKETDRMKLAYWANIIRESKTSGMKISEWCVSNQISIRKIFENERDYTDLDADIRLTRRLEESAPVMTRMIEILKAMDDKKKLTDDELEKVAGGYNPDMFYEERRNEVTDEPPKPETRLLKDKLDDIPPSGLEYAKLPI